MMVGKNDTASVDFVAGVMSYHGILHGLGLAYPAVLVSWVTAVVCSSILTAANAIQVEYFEEVFAREQGCSC